MDEFLKDFIGKKLDSDKVSLVNIKGGSAVEMFDRQLDRVMSNIADVNTTMKTRTITLQVTIAPLDEQRTQVAFAIDVPPAKLCGQASVKGFADIRVDPNGKGIYAKRKEDPQMGLPFSNVTPMRKGE